MDDLRDYVAEASSILRRGDPMSGLGPQGSSLESLVAQNRAQAIQLLLQLLQSGNGTFRKNAAFALGQIGDPVVVEALEQQKGRESARGNIEAIDAALVTLRTIPLSSGSSELDRRRMIDNVYEGRPPGWTTSAGSAATAATGGTQTKPTETKKAGGCFIATAAYGDPWAPEVLVLSTFRDEFLSQRRIGRAFIRFYYAVSPPFAAVIARSVLLRRAAMGLIVRPAVRIVNAKRGSEDGPRLS
jgi:hypothetical protein